MKKLIKLFKKYVDNHGTDTKNIQKEYGVIDDGQGFLYGTREYLYEVIVSKKFGFIEWLVNNDKIDYWKTGKKIWMEIGRAHFPINQYWYVYDNEMGSIASGDYSDYESLLMVLSIQDKPIEFLTYILK